MHEGPEKPGSSRTARAFTRERASQWA